MRKLLTKHADKLRFGLVGVINTAIDFGIFFGLFMFGIDRIVANFFSTSIAFSFSFLANKLYTFKDDSRISKRQLLKFLAVTLFGLWVIQPIVIVAVTDLISPTDGFSLLFGKLVATIVTMIWNYVLYKKFVFKNKDAS